MTSTEKSFFTKLNKEIAFSSIIKKLSVNEKLTDSEASYILTLALIFFDEFKRNRNSKAFFEFGYYIILSYTIIHDDYQPLYDIALNYGFYPIVKFIHTKKLLPKYNLKYILYDFIMDSFSKNGYTETLSQSNARERIINSTENDLSYIAPTSFGKSGIIFDFISKYFLGNKIAIIVPTKSLISQTTKEVKKLKLKTKVLSHDGMYNEDEQFIGIFTQERALRLLQRNDLFYDILVIDEAHNLFEKDSRNILLSRLIRLNSKRNYSQTVIYLSPLVGNSDNLKLNEKQKIIEQRIEFNIKEPEIFQYKLDNRIEKYNRFTNDFYPIGSDSDYLNYIQQNSGRKNFIYLLSPRKIEKFAKDFFDFLPAITISPEIIELKNILDRYVHEDFYIKKFLQKGVLYLHGRIPDTIKDFLEYKFKTIDSIRYLIANTVILEGINLPIDTLFILNTYKLNEKALTNLIGRVNRLDSVFNNESGDLKKLLPKVHFINSSYNRDKSNMTSKIKSLRSRYFADTIWNPTLSNFDVENLKFDKETKYKKILELEEIAKNERYILQDHNNTLSKFKSELIFHGVNEILNLTDAVLDKLIGKINYVVKREFWKDLNIVDKVFEVFVKDFENDILDFEFKRLKSEEARNFYKGFLKANKGTLKSQIVQQINYFDKRIENNKAIFYMGESYGEIEKETSAYPNPRPRYVDLSKKNKIVRANLAIVKIKMEENFIGFKFRKFIEVLFEMDAISEEEYNNIVYGTNDTNRINLLKAGFSSGMLAKFEIDDQVKNIQFDKYLNLTYNENFRKYRETLDDFCNFEIDKYI